MVESMDLLKQTSSTNWTHVLVIPDMSEMNIIYSKIPSLIRWESMRRFGI
jgi:hypothetical protein